MPAPAITTNTPNVHTPDRNYGFAPTGKLGKQTFKFQGSTKTYKSARSAGVFKKLGQRIAEAGNSEAAQVRRLNRHQKECSRLLHNICGRLAKRGGESNRKVNRDLTKLGVRLQYLKDNLGGFSPEDFISEQTKTMGHKLKAKEMQTVHHRLRHVDLEAPDLTPLDEDLTGIGGGEFAKRQAEIEEAKATVAKETAAMLATALHDTLVAGDFR